MIGELAKLGGDAIENFLGKSDEVHFVDGGDDVLHAEQMRDVGVAARLAQNALGRVHQHHGGFGGGSAGGHVARVLLVARRVGDDELAARRGKIAVGDVDGDALLALGAQAVGEQRKIDGAAGAIDLALLHGGELVLEDGLAVVEQAADQRGFAVVHAARGGEAQQAQSVRQRSGGAHGAERAMAEADGASVGLWRSRGHQK